VKLSVPVDDGSSIEFECADTLISRWVSRAILEGDTYPRLLFLDDVRVVFDVGASCGSGAVVRARVGEADDQRSPIPSRRRLSHELLPPEDPAHSVPIATHASGRVHGTRPISHPSRRVCR
jgi:hypothetical protein